MLTPKAIELVEKTKKLLEKNHMGSFEGSRLYISLSDEGRVVTVNSAGRAFDEDDFNLISSYCYDMDVEEVKLAYLFLETTDEPTIEKVAEMLGRVPDQRIYDYVVELGVENF